MGTITRSFANLITASGPSAISIADGSLAATKIGTGIVNDTEFNYLDGASSAIQTQIDNKAGAGFAIAMSIAL